MTTVTVVCAAQKSVVLRSSWSGLLTRSSFSGLSSVTVFKWDIRLDIMGAGGMKDPCKPLVDPVTNPAPGQPGSTGTVLVNRCIVLSTRFYWNCFS